MSRLRNPLIGLGAAVAALGAVLVLNQRGEALRDAHEYSAASPAADAPAADQGPN